MIYIDSAYYISRLIIFTRYPEDIPNGTAIPHWAYQDVTVCLISCYHTFRAQAVIEIQLFQCNPRSAYWRCVHCDTFTNV